MKTLICIFLGIAVAGSAFGQGKPEKPNQVGVLVEYVELDARTANKLVRKHASSLSAALLREELEVMIDGGEARMLASSYTKTRSGQRATVHSIIEHIYGTEYDPPEIPQTATLTNAEAPSTAANPTAFEARNVGPSLEFEPYIDPTRNGIELNVAPQLVRYLGRDYMVEGLDEMAPNDPRALLSTMYMPKYYTIKCRTFVTVSDGDTVLLSLNRPYLDGDKMVMILLRADILK